MLKLALGPIPYYWPRETVFRFYETLASTAIDIVYLGETVCSRRHELRLSDWLSIADTVAAAGKQVVLSTLVLLESTADVTAMRKITDNGRFEVEANDMGAGHALSSQQIPFIAGPHLNIYNSQTLDVFAELGAKRWVLPLEMGRTGLLQILQHRPEGLATEVFAYGRMPLAFSARCFTARNRNLPKDDCQFSCLDHPDGLLLRTREEQPFLVLNGTQTQSALVYNLIDELDQMQQIGVDVVRISPQATHTEKIIDVFDQVRAHALTPREGLQRTKEWMPEQPCNGYWHGVAGLDQMAGMG